MQRTINKPLVLSILFFAMIFLEPIWVRTPGGFWNVFFYLAIVVLFFWLIVRIFKEFYLLIKERHNLKFKLLIPIIIMSLSMYFSLFFPLGFNLESLYGNVVFRACREGTQNQSTLKLMDNEKFEVHSTGVFFSDNYYDGTYSRNEDTIFLRFDIDKPRLLSDTLVIREDYLFAVKMDTIVPTHYYLGFCKGLN